ncbi:MAG TPA: dihydroorotate dehydrogenase electron transfer subunit [Clostridiaceae bacterium]
MEYKRCKVKSNKEIEKDIFVIEVQGKFQVIPGQFFMLRAWGEEPVLSRPISVYKIGEDSLSFLYQIVGRGTKLIARVKVGEEIELLGALGNGFPLSDIQGKIAIVAGGIGIAPMAHLIGMIKANYIDLYVGFRDKTFALDGLEKYSDNIFTSTESGSVGYKGYITDLIKPEKYDLVLCCGPEAMMKVLLNKCKEARVPILVSTEKHMACGIGACLVCTCKTINGNKKSCKDGPVFRGEELI